HSSGISILLDYHDSTTNPNVNLTGKIYSGLPLSNKKTGLPFNLNSCGWDLSYHVLPGRSTLYVNNNAAWNNYILNEMLPTVYINLIKSLIDDNDNRTHEHQIISKYWPMPKNNDGYVSFGK